MEILASLSRSNQKPSSTEAELLFDPIRRAWVAQTPEETIRQSVLKKMVEELGYPPSLITVEKDLKQLPHITEQKLPKRRVDILVFGKNVHEHFPLYPLILVECKASPNLSAKVLQQVVAYNDFVGAFIVAIATPQGFYSGEFDQDAGHFKFSPFFPSYSLLLSRYSIQTP